MRIDVAPGLRLCARSCVFCVGVSTAWNSLVAAITGPEPRNIIGHKMVRAKEAPMAVMPTYMVQERMSLRRCEWPLNAGCGMMENDRFFCFHVELWLMHAGAADQISSRLSRCSLSRCSLSRCSSDSYLL